MTDEQSAKAAEAKSERHRLAREQMERDLKDAPTRKELAWRYLKAGMAPEWCAMRYGFPVEVMREAQRVWVESQKKKAVDR